MNLHPIIEDAYKKIQTKPLKNIKKFRELMLQGRPKLMHKYSVNEIKFDLSQQSIKATKNLLKEVIKAGFNPFNIPVDLLEMDLLTDSGTSEHYPEQIKLLNEWKNAVPCIHTYAYAGSLPRRQLNIITNKIFGDEFEHYPALQGRAAEHLLLHSLVSHKILSAGDLILSNRPFDTTKGHIESVGLKVLAYTPLADPSSFCNSETVFMGNAENFSYDSRAKAFLVTVTDNGGGGQPVSMSNFRKIVEFARSHKMLVWVDACRIFENALFIHIFEEGYQYKSILEIVGEMLKEADVVTISYKKMYSHSGGCILLRKNSPIIGHLIRDLGKSIQQETTKNYGLGFETGYAGLTGEEMIEIISGLFESVNPNRIAERILQPIQVSAMLRDIYGLPIIGGGHAMYIAADQVLPNVNKTNCPAEYLNAIIMAATSTRGCGLGNFLYGGRKPANGSTELTTPLSMDSLRLAIPRNVYSTQQIYKTLSVIGAAYKKGLFKQLNGGLKPESYSGDGFDHFTVRFKLIKENEFVEVVDELIGKIKVTG